MSIIKRKAGSEDIVKSVLEFDEVPTEGSPNLVESGAVAQAIGNLGQPLQWKGPATVAQLNTGITGIQPGWTYTLTDAGTLTDGSITVDVGDEVAWTEDGKWFKVGGDGGVKYVSTSDSYSDIQAIIGRGQFPIMKVAAGQGYNYYYPAFENSQAAFVFKCVTDDGVYGLVWNGSAWAAQDAVIYGMGSDTKSEVDIDQGVLAVDGNNTVTSVVLTTVNAITFSAAETVPAFALEIDNTGNSNDVTINVQHGPDSLKYSVNGGNVVGAGKYMQLTCVGSCWTLAEFVTPGA